MFSKTAQVKPDAQGFYSENFEFPTRTKGWFRIDAKLMQGNDAAASDFMTAAVVCEPVPTAPGLEPFGGAAGGTQAFEAMRRIGVGWLEWHVSWKIVERRKGQYDYKWLIDYDRMAEMKKKGFFNKVIYTIQAPPWEYDEKEADEAKKLKLSLERYFPFDPKSLPGWRAFVADSMKRYGKYMYRSRRRTGCLLRSQHLFQEKISAAYQRQLCLRAAAGPLSGDFPDCVR